MITELAMNCPNCQRQLIGDARHQYCPDTESCGYSSRFQQPTPQTPTPETKINVQAVPTLKHLRHYLDYQYPASRGDIQLNKICNQIAELERELDKPIVARQIAETIWRDMADEKNNVLAELTQLRNVCDELAERLSKSIGATCEADEKNEAALANYSTLPHVIRQKQIDKP